MTQLTIRPLLEDGADVFIRFNEGVSILKKVVATEHGVLGVFRFLLVSVSRSWSALETRSISRRRSAVGRHAALVTCWFTRTATRLTSRETRFPPAQPGG